MPPLTNKPSKIFYKIADRLLPDNCRSQLMQASDANRVAHDDMICILQDYASDIKKLLKKKAVA